MQYSSHRGLTVLELSFSKRPTSPPQWTMVCRGARMSRLALLLLALSSGVLAGTLGAVRGEGVTQEDSTTPAQDTTEETASTELNTSNELNTVGGDVRLTSLEVRGVVRHRYATVEVRGEMVNKGDAPDQAHFLVHLPDSAFVTNAILEVGKERMVGEVRERKGALLEFQQAVAAGQTAGHVATSSVRDASHVRISVNLAALAKASFNLTYEELLVRRKGRYELAVNLSPEQRAEHLSVDIHILESSNLTFVRVPPFDSALAPDGKDEERENPSVKVERSPTNGGEARVRFETHAGPGEEGVMLPGPLLVRYDVEHGAVGGEVLLLDGYFVHFLAAGPEREAGSSSLPKHAVFVLDSSGSMWGRKLRQLKDAMGQILAQLRRQDVFSIVTFSTSAAEWSIQGLEPAAGRGVYHATRRNIALAQEFIDRMEASGATNIQSALRRALTLAARYKNVTLHPGVSEGANYTTPPPPQHTQVQPVIVFLTDGMPTAGELRLTRILNSVKHSNQGPKASIFALAFGEGANRMFLRKLSLQNHGFSRRIYEGADAALQLQSFYQEVASPLITNLTFTYVDSKVNLSTVTVRQFPTFFSGSEAVVAGRLLPETTAEVEGWGSELPAPSFTFIAHVSGQTAGQHDLAAAVPLPPPLIKVKQEPKSKRVGHLERAWAYLTVRQLLEASTLQDTPLEDPEHHVTAPTPVPLALEDQPRIKALALALKYGFVTPLTSLVMVANTPPASGKPKESPLEVVSDLDEPIPLEGMPIQDKVIPTDGSLGLPPRVPALIAGTVRPAPVSLQTHLSSTTNPPVETSTPSAIKESSWMDAVPWLTERLLPEDQITIPLNGSDETRTVLRNPDPQVTAENRAPCTAQETQGEGRCTHLAHCPQAYNLTWEHFLARYCDIDNKYVGVCCSSTQPNQEN